MDSSAAPSKPTSGLSKRKSAGGATPSTKKSKEELSPEEQAARSAARSAARAAGKEARAKKAAAEAAAKAAAEAAAQAAQEAREESFRRHIIEWLDQGSPATIFLVEYGGDNYIVHGNKELYYEARILEEYDDMLEKPCGPVLDVLEFNGVMDPFGYRDLHPYWESSVPDNHVVAMALAHTDTEYSPAAAKELCWAIVAALTGRDPPPPHDGSVAKCHLEGLAKLTVHHGGPTSPHDPCESTTGLINLILAAMTLGVYTDAAKTRTLCKMLIPEDPNHDDFDLENEYDAKRSENRLRFFPMDAVVAAVQDVAEKMFFAAKARPVAEAKAVPK
jgi:hypothetical protein